MYDILQFFAIKFAFFEYLSYLCTRFRRKRLASPNARCYRLAVRTKDSQSLNRGSIPRSTTKIVHKGCFKS